MKEGFVENVSRRKKCTPGYMPLGKTEYVTASESKVSVQVRRVQSNFEHVKIRVFRTMSSGICSSEIMSSSEVTRGIARDAIRTTSTGQAAPAAVEIWGGRAKNLSPPRAASPK